MNILVIIPAKMDSTRLPGKNLKEINGKSLVELSVDYANNSKHAVRIVVSSEDETVQQLANTLDVIGHIRPIELCGDTEVVDVYTHVFNEQKTFPHFRFDLVIGLQPDNPNRSNTLDECIDYMIDNNYDDLITVNEQYKRSGSVRIFKREYFERGEFSKRMGCIKDEAVDVHYESDLETVKEKI